MRDLSQYAAINASYSSVIPGPNPPVRVALGTGLNEKTPVLLRALAYSREKHVMHVQSLSHWAPANIGPYSQAIRVRNHEFVNLICPFCCNLFKSREFTIPLSVFNQGLERGGLQILDLMQLGTMGSCHIVNFQ